ncbi:MAG: DNA-deoxyinosine glycosylase [Sphingomonadaceae bacterium]|nr:DNA-deoxyinosine glycosylase [Sphingomonadaceae bacterium]
MRRKASFPPIADTSTRIVILGSLPGEESLRQRQYYAHPQNRFWELVGGAIGIELRALDYDNRLATLLECGIGLWDVIADARRTGSLDSAIREEASNDLAAFVATLPALAAIAFNGKKAAAIGRKKLGAAGDKYRLIDLPSSSPAYAAMPFVEKQRLWSAIGETANAL